jgi:hypothetical protein
MQFHFCESNPTSLEGFLDECHVVMIKSFILSLEVYDLANSALNDKLRTPETGYFSGVKDSSRSLSDTCCQDTVVFSMDASAA